MECPYKNYLSVIFYYVYITCLRRACTWEYLWSAYGGWESVSDPCELEQQAVVSCLTWVLGTNSGPPQEHHTLIPTELSLCPDLFLDFLTVLLLSDLSPFSSPRHCLLSSYASTELGFCVCVCLVFKLQ